MNKITRAFAVGAMLACTVEPARSQIDSQAFCALFAHYFTNPPSAFIAERGDQISAQKSNRDHPNASCTISLTKRATHIAQCRYNEGVSEAVALAWYETMVANVEECISKQPERGGYKKDALTFELKDGTAVTEIEWENNDPDDAYHSVEIGRALSPNGYRFTLMEFDYRKN